MPADIDLFKDEFSRFGDPELFDAVEAFTRVTSPANDRTQEGYLVDFKATWSSSALQTVAAFANTFGGLLLVGVSEDHGRADQIVGIQSQRQELKTSIASSIASNISPTPPYEIRDVAFPSDPARHLCIVRVRKGNSLYLLTKKGEQPVYIRNEDESRPADATRLQALLSMRAIAGHPIVSDPLPYKQPSIGTNQLYVTRAQTQNGQPQRFRSETFLQIALMPEEPIAVRLDLGVERKALSIVRETYPEIARNVDDTAPRIGASFADSRLRDWYLITYFEEFRDYEMKWAIDAHGGFHFVTQVACKFPTEANQPETWSLCDLMTNLDCSIQAAHEFWDYLDYPGEAQITVQLHVETLPLFVRTGGMQSAYAWAFYERDGSRKRARTLLTSALVKAPMQGSRGGAFVNLNYASRFGSHSEPVALLTNQLLRDLGYAVNLADLRTLL
ncbi:MAG: ATP-binding protein [Acidobacteriia bacterium]|nr:ATP-binding protein [Terriglobia bacterium]